MQDKSELLRSLKIDRDSGPGAPGAAWWRRWGWLVLAAAVVAAVLWLRPGSPQVIETLTPTIEGGVAPAGSSVLEASGYVVARRRATVSSKLTGKVVELLIEEGSRVEQGEVLARIDDTNLRAQLELARAQREAAAAQLAEVRVQLSEAERNLQRTRELAERQLLSASARDTAQAEVDTLRARLASTRSNVNVAERNVAVQARQLDDSVVRAPFAGVITVKNAQPGEMISPLSAGGDGTRTGIGTLVDMDSLEVEVDVNENFINRVSAGQPALTTLNAYPDWQIPSKVIAVIPTADRSKATVKVRIGLGQTDARVLPEMGARVSFLAPPIDVGAKPAAARRIWIAARALRREQDQDVVYVVKDEQVQRRVVGLGERRDDRVEIVSGLDGNETLAASELARLRDGSRVSAQIP